MCEWRGLRRCKSLWSDTQGFALAGNGAQVLNLLQYVCLPLVVGLNTSTNEPSPRTLASMPALLLSRPMAVGACQSDRYEGTSPVKILWKQKGGKKGGGV